MGNRKRFAALDGLRGIAALAVAQRHTFIFFGWVIPQSYLAVDLFFVLSGFVITHAYEEQLQSGLSVASFMRARLRRLYPLYALATFFGFALVMTDNLFKGLGITPEHLALALAVGLMFLPLPFTLHPEHPMIYPFSHSCWSLFFELVANLAHAVFIKRLTNRLLAVFVISAGLALSFGVVRMGAADAGWNWPTFAWGFARVGFGYSAGVLLYRLRPFLNLSLHVWPIIPAAMLILLIGGPLPMGAAAYTLIALWLVIPAIVLLGSFAREDWLCRRVLLPLGMWSYALYVLHPPLAELVAHIHRAATGKGLPTAAPWGGYVFVAILTAVSWVATTYFDASARAWLSKRRSRRQSPNPAQITV